jgi:hypothetical protein
MHRELTKSPPKVDARDGVDTHSPSAATSRQMRVCALFAART